MTIEQTVEIPPSHRLLVDVPHEVPAGKAILTLTTLSENRELEYAQKIWSNNRAQPEELKAHLQKLQGSLGEKAFNALDGVAYQRKVREEWGD